MLLNVLWYLLVGLAAGWLAGVLTRGRGFGCIGNVLVGAVGGLVGGFVFDLAGLEFAGIVGSLFTAFAGAVLLIVVVRLISKI